MKQYAALAAGGTDK